MAFEDDVIKGSTAIYKFVFENPGVHRNVLRKQMWLSGNFQ